MLSIGMFSKISNVTTKTLRYYDEIGLIKPIYVNNHNGYRYYDVSQLETILLITKLKQYCFSLDEIAEVLNNRSDDSLLFSLMKQKRECIEKKIDCYKYLSSQIDKDISNLERGIHIMSYLNNIEIKLVETEQKNIFSIRQTINLKNFEKLMRKLFEKIAKENLTMAGEPMAIYYSKEFNPENYDVEVAIPVKEVINGTRDLQGNLCAMTTLNGPYSELTSVYAKMNEWIEKENYTISSPPYEVYYTDPKDTPPDKHITKIYIPIKK